MPAKDSPAIICARFLRSNNYNETLEAFLSEAGLPPDAGIVGKGDLTLEKILEEKKVFDLSLRFERLGAGDGDRGWSVPAPSQPVAVSTLPSSTNLLHVSVESFVNETSNGPFQLLFATTADRRLNLIAPNSTFTLFKSNAYLQDSPILACIVIGKRFMTTVTTGMSGQTILYDHKDDRVLEERRDHKKYVVKVAKWEDVSGTWVATAGWDAKIFIYRLGGGEDDTAHLLGDPVATLTLQTNPETITFVKHPDSDDLILLVTRRDSTSLHFYALPPHPVASSLPSSPPGPLHLLGSQDLAPHSNAWIAFSPSSVALCPTDPTLLAVATSAVPHMKLIVVRLLLPAIKDSSVGHPEPATQADQTRAKLAIQDREDAAIRLHVSTLAPQTPYSTPQVCWRPDGTGVWVNGDDGVLRGMDVQTGKIVTTLKDGHEAGSKIRSVWAGYVRVDGAQEEWVVSGGFDKRLVVWKLEKGET